MSDDDVDKDKSILVPHTFNSAEIIEIEYEGKPVFLAQQVGAALGYADPDKLANNVVQKWSDDFIEGRDFLKLTNGKLADFKAAVNCRPDRAAVVDPRTPNLILLTESGAQLAAILSRTPQGRTFRRWLLDVVLVAWRARHAPAPSEGRQGRRKALPGPLPVPGMPREEEAVRDAQIKGLDAYEALAPGVRRRGLIAMAIRLLALEQAAWLRDQLRVKAGLTPPEFRYTRKEAPDHAPMFEARAQVWWLVERLPDAALVEAHALIEDAKQQPAARQNDALNELMREIRFLPSESMWGLASALSRSRGQPATHRAAVALLIELIARGPGAVKQAEEWCKRLWALGDP